MNKKLLLSVVAVAGLLQAKAQTYIHTPVPITGFTADVIADGSGSAANSTTADVDGENYNLVAQNFVNPSNVSPTSFLPTGGLISSPATPGLTFQMEPYTANNSLRINTTTSTGSLTLVTPRAADKLNLMVTSAYGATFTATVNFTDGSSEVFTNNVVPNWFDGTIPLAIKGISRVLRTTNAIENSTSNPRIYQFSLALSAANTSKLIQSIAFTKTTTGVKEVMHVFAITASTAIPNDVGVAAITTPTSPVVPGVSQAVTVTVKNFGANPVASAALGFSVDGTTVLNNYAFTASPALATNAVSTPVPIGSFTFTPGNHKIKAWGLLPNGLADGMAANDTAQITIISCNALTGNNYTIDKGSAASATNFTSLSAAVQALTSCGISGPVTLTVAPNSGPYNEQVVLPVITGSSAANTITFEGNNNTISATTATPNVGVFTLDGADYVKINNFTINLPTSATTGSGVQLRNNADNNIITNNTINLSLTSTASSLAGIIIGTSATGSGTNGSNALIQNNSINGGYYGITINGTTGNVGAVGNQLKNNQVKDNYAYGVYLNYATNTIVEGNDISRPTRATSASTFYGFYLANISIGNQIRKNRFHNTHDVATTKSGTVYGIYSGSAGAANSENIFSNNLFYNLNNTGGSTYAFYNTGGNNTWYYHNTVSADDPAISYASLRGMWFASASTNVRFFNNILSLTSAATNKYAIYLASATVGLTSNGNNLNIGATGKVGYYSADKITLADWKTANSNAYDQNSVGVDANFANPATGNLEPKAKPLDNVGVPQTVITEDLNGITRSTTTPDAGAYEFTSPAADVGVSAILSLATGCGLSNQETVSVTLNNYGTAAQSNIPVSYTINGGTPVTETFAGPLAIGASATYNFTTKADLSVTNDYTIVAQTNLVGDGYAGNDDASKTITAIPLVTTYPYSENFETNHGGWISGGTASSWAWGTPAKATINSAASGTKAWVTKLINTYNVNEKSQVSGPCFNFTSLVNPIFEMKAWWETEFSNDGAVLQSSIDGGTTWQNVGAKGDPNNWFNDNSIGGAPGGQPAATAEGWTGRTATSNGSGGWVTVKHALTGLGGQANVKLRIAFGADGLSQYEGFAFDDVMIYETPVNDGGVTAIVAPGTGCGLTNQETVSITVKNFGTAALSNIPVSFKVDGGAFVNEVLAGPVAPNTTANYTFTAKADLSVLGPHSIVAKTAVSGDILASNDSIVKSINSFQLITSLPYTEGFENGNGNWIADGTNSSWALGTPAKTVINSAAAGTKSWVTGLTANYGVNEQSYVTSPCFDFSTIGDPDFEMKAWWNTEFSFDGAVLQSSIDGGTTWQNVGTTGDPNNWYNDNTINGAPGGQTPATAEGWSGRNITSNGSNGWVTVKHRLNGLGGKSAVKLRIAFGSDNIGQDDGFAFDEIRILDNTNNLAVNSVVPFNKVCGMNAAESITAAIQNLGAVAATGFTVSYTVNGGTPVTETFTGNLASGATTNYTFTQTANLVATGSYTIVVTVTMAGDPDATNNSATYTFSNSSFAGLPPVFSFEPAGAGLTQLRTVTNTRSAIIEGTAASNGTASTKGLIMDGVDHASWTIPVGIVDPWASNPENLAVAYICFNPSGGLATDSLWLTFDLKQLFKGANANTNLRVTVDGSQVGPTFRPPFAGSPIVWTPVKISLNAYKNQPGIQVAIESSVKETFAAGAGTANLIDNIQIKRRLITGVKADLLQSQLHVFPNPGNGQFNLDLPAGKAYQLVVTDLSGKLILQKTANGNTQLNLENNAKGIYLLKVSSENGTAIRKLIIE